MKTIRLTKNLWLHEYIQEGLYKQYAENKPHYLMGLIDQRLPILDQFMRDRFGMVTINNWSSGGDRQWSGLRTPESPYYSKFSQHSYGRASDKLFRDATAEEVREDIKKNYEKLYQPLGLTCIEDNVSWVHSDVRYHTFGGLLIVKP